MMGMHTGKKRPLPEGLGWIATVTIQGGRGQYEVRLYPTSERRNWFGRTAYLWMATVSKTGGEWSYCFSAYRTESAQALVRRAHRIHEQREGQ